MPDTDHPLIFGKLIEAARLMEGVEKGGWNSGQNFKFRGIEQLTKACAPIFKEVGIVMVPHMQVVESVPQPDRGYRSVVEAGYTFYAEDGSSVVCATIGEGVDTYDKATNKAMSAAFKYALLQTLCIGDPEDDSDAQSPPAAEPATPRARSVVSAKDWAEWETTRSNIVADDSLKEEFRAWALEQPFKIERSISANNFSAVVGKAAEMLSRTGTAAPDPDEAPFDAPTDAG